MMREAGFSNIQVIDKNNADALSKSAGNAARCTAHESQHRKYKTKTALTTETQRHREKHEAAVLIFV